VTSSLAMASLVAMLVEFNPGMPPEARFRVGCAKADSDIDPMMAGLSTPLTTGRRSDG